MHIVVFLNKAEHIPIKPEKGKTLINHEYLAFPRVFADSLSASFYFLFIPSFCEFLLLCVLKRFNESKKHCARKDLRDNKDRDLSHPPPVPSDPILSLGAMVWDYRLIET
jgi:hypothetical protein